MQDELKPVAWMHTLHMERGQTYTRLLDHDGTDEYEPSRTGFGIPGRDYSEEYAVTATPLYAHPLTATPVDDRETPVGDHQMVEAVDREAAWPYRPSCYKAYDYTDWMAGKYDLSAAIIKGFTRHRQAALTAARAQDRNEIEAWQVAAETWQQNFQDASCENQRLRETLERIEKFKAWGSPKYALAELRQFARQALAAGEHRKEAP